MSYISGGGFSSTSSVDSSDSETAARMKMAEEMKLIQDKAKDVFRTAPIPFMFDFEDYENCKLNGELKRIIASKAITVPIVPIKNTSEYFIGTRKFTLSWKNRNIWVEYPYQESKKFFDFLIEYQPVLQNQLCFFMIKSGWTIEKVVQSLLDSKPIDNVSKRDIRLLKSYTEAHLRPKVSR